MKAPVVFEFWTLMMQSLMLYHPSQLRCPTKGIRVNGVNQAMGSPHPLGVSTGPR